MECKQKTGDFSSLQRAYEDDDEDRPEAERIIENWTKMSSDYIQEVYGRYRRNFFGTDNFEGDQVEKAHCHYQWKNPVYSQEDLANMTEEEKAEAKRRRNIEYKKQWLANLSEEKRQQYYEKQRSYSKTKEYKSSEKYKQKIERQKEKVAKETPEERQIRLRKHKILDATKRLRKKLELEWVPKEEIESQVEELRRKMEAEPLPPLEQVSVYKPRPYQSQAKTMNEQEEERTTPKAKPKQGQRIQTLERALRQQLKAQGVSKEEADARVEEFKRARKEELKQKQRDKVRSQLRAKRASMTEEEKEAHKRKRAEDAKKYREQSSEERRQRFREYYRNRSKSSIVKARSAERERRKIASETPAQRRKRLRRLRISARLRALRRKLEQSGVSKDNIESQVEELRRKLDKEIELPPLDQLSSYVPKAEVKRRMNEKKKLKEKEAEDVEPNQYSKESPEVRRRRLQRYRIRLAVKKLRKQLESEGVSRKEVEEKVEELTRTMKAEPLPPLDQVSAYKPRPNIRKPKVAEDLKKKELQCSTCEKFFANKSALLMHLKSHSRPSKLPKRDKKKVKDLSGCCEICGKVFKHKASIPRHVAMAHGVGEDISGCCEICGKVIPSKWNIPKHMATAHGIGNFTCDVGGCSKAFVKLEELELEDHKKYVHEGVKKVKEKKRFCQFCGKGFPDIAGVKRHESAIHLNRESKPFQCHLCAKGFAVEDYLKYHLDRTHKIKNNQTQSNKVFRATDVSPVAPGKKNAKDSISVTTPNSYLPPKSNNAEVMIPEQEASPNHSTLDSTDISGTVCTGIADYLSKQNGPEVFPDSSQMSLEENSSCVTVETDNDNETGVAPEPGSSKTEDECELFSPETNLPIFLDHSEIATTSKEEIPEAVLVVPEETPHARAVRLRLLVSSRASDYIQQVYDRYKTSMNKIKTTEAKKVPLTPEEKTLRHQKLLWEIMASEAVMRKRKILEEEEILSKVEIQSRAMDLRRTLDAVELPPVKQNLDPESEGMSRAEIKAQLKELIKAIDPDCISPLDGKSKEEKAILRKNRYREKQQAKLQNMTEEEKKEHLAYMRKWRREKLMKMTEEERKNWYTRRYLSNQARLAKMTEERREARRKRQLELCRQRKKKLSLQELERRREMRRRNVKNWRLTETPEKRQIRLRKKQILKAVHRRRMKLEAEGIPKELIEEELKELKRTMEEEPLPPLETVSEYVPKKTGNELKGDIGCPFCGSSHFVRREILVFSKHVQECAESKPIQDLNLKCSLCKEWSCPSENIQEFMGHIVMCREKQTTPIPWRHTIIKCNLCKDSCFLPFPEFARHIYRYHQHRYGCTQCPFRGVHSGIAEHWKWNHKTLRDTPTNQRYTKLPFGVKPPLPDNIPWWCPSNRCLQQFQDEGSRDLHLQDCKYDIPERWKSCASCEKQYFFEEELLMHRVIVHGYIEDGKRKNVQQLKPKDRSGCCEMCGKVISNKWLIPQHMASAHGIGDFNCDVEGCSKVFAKKMDLVNHKKSKHEGVKRPERVEEKKYFCQFCGKGFSIPAKLKLHESAIHLNRESKPFKCHLCDKTFAVEDYVKYHVERTHKIKS